MSNKVLDTYGLVARNRMLIDKNKHY